MRRKRDLHILARVGTAIVGLIALGSCLAFAQGSTGAISGVVRDATGAVIPGVTVTARHIESGLTRTAVSSETGGYNLQLLPVGGQQAVVDLTLEVGAAEELSTVTGEAPIVNTTLASTSGLVNEAQIKDLPLNGRS